MKFKVGDKVRIKTWEKMKKEFGLDSWGDIRCKLYFTSEMKQMGLCEKEFIISGITNNEKLKGLDADYDISEDMAELVKKENNQAINPSEEIRIFKSHSSNNVNALMYKDGKVVKSAVAKCNPKDTYDFEIGAKLAMERLMGKSGIKEQDFKIGDRVKPKLGGMHDWIRSNGTVIGFFCVDGPVLVEFDKCDTRLHNGNGDEKNGKVGKDHHCWYCNKEHLEKIN